MHYLNEVSTTSTFDFKLFNKLGFERFSIKNNQQVLIGEYDFPNIEGAKAKVWVNCMPAQVWTIEVTSHSGIKTTINTGTGSLSDFWPTVVLLADDMIEIS